MNKLKLSIVIPVYNGAAYIKTALETLTAQMMEGVELVVIDDGSVDGTAQVITDSFAEQIRSGAINLLVQPNRGVSAARNLGIDSARGDYIGFFDGDDAALPGYIQKILAAAAGGVDIIEFGYKTFVASIDETLHGTAQYTNKSFGLHQPKAVLDGIHAIARWYPWTRVFKSVLFDGIRFPSGVRMCEDVMTIPLLYEKAGSVLNLSDALYGYRINQAGATFNVKPDYVPNLESFYQTIPRSGMRRHDYLRFTIAFAIASCQLKSQGAVGLPKAMIADMHKLRFVASVYRELELRKVIVVLYPTLFTLIRRFTKPARSNA